MNSVKFLIISLIIFSSLNFQSGLSVGFQNQINANLSQSENSVNNTLTFNDNLTNSIINPGTLQDIAEGYFNNTNSSYIVEIHKNVLYFRYASNYSTFFTYHSNFDTLKYFPVQNDSTITGIIVCFNRFDPIMQGGHQYSQNYFEVHLVGNNQIIASYEGIDENIGENMLGGVLIGDFDHTHPGLEILISYVELFTNLNVTNYSESHILLFNLTNLNLIRDFWLNNSIFINKDYYFQKVVNPDIIPTVETNFTNTTSKVAVFSGVNFSTTLFNTNWYPIDNTEIQMKTIYDYNSNSYLLLKTDLNSSSSINLFKFKANFSTYLSIYSSPYDIQAENSSIIIRVLPNNTLCYLIQVKNESVWKSFDNSTILIENLPEQTTWVYKGFVNYNNDNISDVFIFSYKDEELSNFIIQDGSNLTNTLTNFSVINMSDSFLNSNILIGNFKSTNDTSSFQEEQILFIYKNNYYQLLNNGTTDNILLLLLPKDGSIINYCSNIFYTLSWNVNKGIIASATLYTQNYIYTIQGKQNITLLMESGSSNSVITQYYTIEIRTDSGLLAYDFTSLNFRPNQCSTYSLPVVSENIPPNSFEGKQINGLGIIISTVFVISIVALTLLYYKDHKKID